MPESAQSQLTQYEWALIRTVRPPLHYSFTTCDELTELIDQEHGSPHRRLEISLEWEEEWMLYHEERRQQERYHRQYAARRAARRWRMFFWLYEVRRHGVTGWDFIERPGGGY
jgi:hypothetical protein